MIRRNEIKRSDFKYNFLKNIIFRCDFIGIEERELDKAIEDISYYLRNEGYIKRRVEYRRGFELEVNDPVLLGQQMPDIRSVPDEKRYVFEKEDSAVKISIAISHAVVSIDKTKYVDCLSYCNVLLEVLNYLKKASVYFELKRMGLRKINKCLLRDLDKINTYFNVQYFPLIKYPNESITKTKEIKESCSLKNGYDVNIGKFIIPGILNNEEVFQIVLDSDIYINNIDEKIYENKNIAVKMNDVLFDFYKNMITEEFSNALIYGNFNTDEIIGVESNE